MNDDDLSAFEKELAAMRPRAPSPRLRARLDALVDRGTGDRPRSAGVPESAPGPWRWSRHAPWLAAAAGLALAAVVLWWRPFEPGRAAPEGNGNSVQMAAAPFSENIDEPIENRSVYRPVRARNSLRNRIDEGLVTLENGLSARQYRFQFVDTVVWENSSDGSQFEVSTPREEIVLVPVHTF